MTLKTKQRLTLDALLWRRWTAVLEDEVLLLNLRFVGGTSSIGNVVGTGCLSRARQTRCSAYIMQCIQVHCFICQLSWTIYPHLSFTDRQVYTSAKEHYKVWLKMSQHLNCDYSVMTWYFTQSLSWEFSTILHIFTELTYCSLKWHKLKVKVWFMQLSGSDLYVQLIPVFTTLKQMSTNARKSANCNVQPTWLLRVTAYMLQCI